jgi:hypothetical protein
MENEETVSTSQMAAYHKDYARGFISKVISVQVMHAFQQKAFDVDCDIVVEELMSTIQEQLKSLKKNIKVPESYSRINWQCPYIMRLQTGMLQIYRSLGTL